MLATDVLRAHGILMPEVMIRAAQLEGVELAVAATVLMNETGGGKNIFGHDGVPTGDTYVKGGPVTRESYLAYRAWMRGGSGRRQGVGPTQATSAQYQDTADALGGAWDPLANCRSGFRGIGALIKAYGVQQGARRYNGSGPAAETYGQRFMSRYLVWRALLAGTDISVTPGPVAAPARRRPLGTELVMDPIGFTGSGTRRIFLDPPGAVVIERAFYSWVIDGPDGAVATATAYPQHAGGGTTNAPIPLRAQVRTDGSHTVDRQVFEAPKGTDQITIFDYNVPAGSVAYLVPAFRAAP
jgi:hypothetical protein